MTRNQSLRFVPPVAVIAFAAGFLALTYQIPADARAAPLLVGWATLLLGVVDVVTRLHGPVGELLMRALNPAGLTTSDEGPSAQDTREAVKAMGMIVLLVVMILLIGIVPASLLFITGAFIAGGSNRLVTAAAAIGFTALLWLTFALMLRLDLFPGLLFGGTF